MTPNPLTPTPTRRLSLLRAARRARRGMSLVEVMVVIAIILTLMGIIGYGVMSVYEKSKVETTRLQIGRIVERVTIYTVKHKKPPTTGDGLAAVYDGEKVPQDAWGNDFTYVSPGPEGHDFDIISYGRDGVEGGTGLAADIHITDLDM